MRKLFDKLRRDIADFIGQRDDLLMVASCSENDTGLTLQILRDAEQSSAKNIFLLFADNFAHANPFVSVAVERLREQHGMACEALEGKGLPPMPPMPAALFDESQPPAMRLWRAVCFARSLVPQDGGRRLVWAMFPQRISNRGEYLRFISEFVPHRGLEPWMAGVRLIFRDESGTETYAPELARGPRVRLLHIDLGPGAMEASLQADCADNALPREDRMQAVLSLALLDSAHNRADEALAKYGGLLGYYQETGNRLMQAFVINSIGDIFHRRRDLDNALHWYECAVPPATGANDPVILSTVTKNLADLSYELRRYADAEQYYDGVGKLAGVTLDAGSKIRALEWRGLSQEQQGKRGAAVESIETAAQLSRTMSISPLLRENLAHLQRLYNELGWREKAALAEAELRTAALEEAPR